MKPFEKILVPTDFSENALEAVRIAAELARAYQVPLSIVHVHDVTPYAMPDGMPLYNPQLIAQLLSDCEKELTTAGTRAREWGAAQVETQLLQGAPAHEIVRFAKEHGVGLLVMGTVGRTGLQHLLLGSVAEKVARKAPCPVITVPLRAEASQEN